MVWQTNQPLRTFLRLKFYRNESVNDRSVFSHWKKWLLVKLLLRGRLVRFEGDWARLSDEDEGVSRLFVLNRMISFRRKFKAFSPKENVMNKKRQIELKAVFFYSLRVKSNFRLNKQRRKFELGDIVRFSCFSS